MIEILQEWSDLGSMLLIALNNKIFVYYMVLAMSGRYLISLAKIKYETEKHSKTTKELKSELDKVKVEKSKVESKLTRLEEQVSKNSEKLNKLNLESTFKGKW